MAPPALAPLPVRYISGGWNALTTLGGGIRPSVLGRYINARTTSGITALHYAAFFDHRAAVEELLRHFPHLNAASTSHSYDIDTNCDSMSTPLHFAAVRGNLAVSRQLLHHYVRRDGLYDLEWLIGWGRQGVYPRFKRRRRVAATPHVAAAQHMITCGAALPRRTGGGGPTRTNPRPRGLPEAAANPRCRLIP
jgi:ankyrin repeat protein